MKLPEVATDYSLSLAAALPDEGELIEAPLEDCWSSVKAAINNAAEGAFGFVVRNPRNGWFDEECQTVLDEKNASWAMLLQQGTCQNVERYKQKRRHQTP